MAKWEVFVLVGIGMNIFIDVLLLFIYRLSLIRFLVMVRVRSMY